jgi:integrase
MTARRRKPAGVRTWKGKRQAYIQVHGKTYSKSFPLNTPDATLQKWRTDQRVKYAGVEVNAGSFAADIRDYLSQVSAMPTYRQRAAHLELWARALGRDRSRASITTADINRVLNHWLKTPSKPAKGAKGRPSAPTGIAPATVRKRRTALLSLFTTLDGEDAQNPVRASVNPRPPKAEARGMDYATIARILDAMPESVTKRRVAVIAYTGLPPALLETIRAGDVDLRAGTVRVQPRRKGAGVEAATLELTPQGIEAFRALGVYGRFAVEAANKSFQRACKRVDVLGVTLYDLRHSFGAHMYRVTKDLSTVARFLLHASLTTTERYAKSAMREVDRDAAARAGAAIGEGAKPVPRPVPKRQKPKKQQLKRAG